MNDFTKKEKEVYLSLARPLLKFDLIKKILDKKARELGFKNHDDLLSSTGWHGRFEDE